MSRRLGSLEFDVVVVGGGAAGVPAALAAARSGAKTALIERNPMPGGELVSGMAILSSSNSRGEYLLGGPAGGLIERAAELDGFVGRPFDGRTMWGVCVDPEIMKLVVPEALEAAGVVSFMSSVVTRVATNEAGGVDGVLIDGGGFQRFVRGDVIVDASGDALVAATAGAPIESGGDLGELQPMSLMFRMAPLDVNTFLSFVRENPSEFMLGESDVISKSHAELAADIADAGLPFVCLQGERDGSLLANAIEKGEVEPTTGMYLYPTSMIRREVCVNTTRLPSVDSFDPVEMSGAIAQLVAQVSRYAEFLRDVVPGFEHAWISGVAPRIGVRETRRIIGEERLETMDVVEGRKRANVVAKGGHHIDVHGSGRDQKRVHVEGGRSYDIPYGALVPRNVSNVVVAGRCFSSSREANGSARHMGSCMGMGQAAGVAAAIAARKGVRDVRDVNISELQSELRELGAILDGVA